MLKKATINDLTIEEKNLICNGCGSDSFRPWFSSKMYNLCVIHDLEFAQGGFVLSFFWSNTKLSLRILKQSFNDDPIWQMPFWISISLMYWIVLSSSLSYTFSYALPFRHHSLETIIERANKRKNGINPRASLNEWVQYWTGKWSKIS